jgi:IS605 OrfB family transposase
MIRDWVRLNASQIIKVAERNRADLIVFESLRGYRAHGYDVVDPDQKRRLAFFAYGRIFRKVTEKAVERGMRVVTVPYFESSQHCAECGKKREDYNRWRKNKRDDHSFQCEHCGHKSNSDENAARVLAKVFWGDIVLPVERQSGR